MNTGQLLTVVGALVLLSLVSLSVNTMIINKTTTMLQAEANLNAISLAQTMLDEIMMKAYDNRVENRDTARVYTASEFNPFSGFGPNSTEASQVPLPDVSNRSLKYYTDIDDYHRYRRITSTPRMGPFSVVDSVYYVVETNPDQISTTQTFHKKVIVTVRHPNMGPANITYTPWSGKYYLQLTDVAVYRRYF